MKHPHLPTIFTRIFIIAFVVLAAPPIYAQSKTGNPAATMEKVPLYRAEVTGEKPEQPEYNIQTTGDLVSITFTENTTITPGNFFQKLSEVLGLAPIDHFVLADSGTNDIGYTWYRFTQYYNGVPVKGGQFMLFEKNGRLQNGHGKFYGSLGIDTWPLLSPAQSIEFARKMIHTKQSNTNDSSQPDKTGKNATTGNTRVSTPELVIAPKNGIYSKEQFRLCYRQNVYAARPYTDVQLFIDAHTGELVSRINNNMHGRDMTSTTTLLYAQGERRITTNAYDNGYRLQQSSLRPIQVLNALNKPDPDLGQSVDFINGSTKWMNGVSILSSLTITRVNSDWTDFVEDRGANALPDLYIEIRDTNNNVLYGKSDSYFSETTLPVMFNLNDIRLLTNNTYTLLIYDHDTFSPDDLLGSFVFKKIDGQVPFNANGTSCAMRGSRGVTGALDAYWALERTYSYYQNNFQRNSYDGQNGLIKAYMHPHLSVLNGDPINAYWSKSTNTIRFGDGDVINSGPLTPLDVCGHELTHGYIQHNSYGDLEYIGESGALNESFSDIFGTCVEFESAPEYANWEIGERALTGGRVLRSMSDPKLVNTQGLFSPQPNTYKGRYWYHTNVPCTGGPYGNDLCGVHTNSGVQNFWFYLLANGGTGYIDDSVQNPLYKVPAAGIGIQKASRIAYRTMMDLLTSNATHEDAYIQSLHAAELERFTNPSKEYRSVREAWFAVGVAKRPKINSFTPGSGTIGTTVIINGENFTGISYVGFNDKFVAPSDFFVISGTNYSQISVRVPAGATTGYISIVAGYDTVKSEQKFIVCNPFTLSVSSNNGTSFTVNATGGISPYQYSLDNIIFQAGNTFSGLQPGTYTVYVKDSAGCTGEHTFLVSNPIQCNVQSGSGGQGTSFINQILGTDTGFVRVTYQMYSVPDRMDVYYNNNLMASTNGLVSGTGTLLFYYAPDSAGPYSCVIKISAPNPGTAWNFTAYCPTPTIRSATGTKTAEVVKAEPEPISRPGITAFPNPTTGNVYIRANGIKGKATLTVTDIFGRKIMDHSIAGNDVSQLKMVHLPAGTYIIFVKMENGSQQTLKINKVK